MSKEIAAYISNIVAVVVLVVAIVFVATFGGELMPYLLIFQLKVSYLS
jgi:hypothetical protein